MTAAAVRPTEPRSREARDLFGPTSDFLWLGGFSLLVFPVLLLLPTGPLKGSFVVGMFLLSNVINHPHFAISYRIFYEDFGRKVSGEGATDPTLRYRYAVAGLLVPLVLGIALPAAMIFGSPETLGYGYNIMIFFVGWHYVKQGYGMAMVDAAFKRRYFSDIEKKALLVTAYSAWITSWTHVNRSGKFDEQFELPVTALSLPNITFLASATVLVVSSVVTIGLLAARFRRRQPTAWTGVTAFVVSAFLWMLFVRVEPLFLLVTPALHSLQYLYVVKRFEINRHQADPSRSSFRVSYWKSVALGFAMFLAIPTALDQLVGYDGAVWGGLPFTFMFLIFINVHHYFLDNVMWRRGNPEVSQYLFA